MTGAIVTMNGEAHKGFHQCPNVMRDKYLPLLKPDGYGLFNYLLSWANTDTCLSTRRMKNDLGCSQDRIEAMEARLLEHCGHFIAKIEGRAAEAGKAGIANRWHIDAEVLWAENQIHMAEGARRRLERRAERRGFKSVPESGALTPDLPVSVPESGAQRTGERCASVPESGTHKRKGNTSPKEEEDARANLTFQASTAGGAPDPEDTSPSGKPNASSSEKDLAAPAERTGATPDQTQAPSVQAAATPSQADSDQVASSEGKNWPEGLEEVPGERENIHEQEQAAAAVNARLNQLCNGRWLSSPKGTTDPAWIDEVGSAGLDRHLIADVVSLDRLEAFWKESVADRLNMQVQNVTPIPQVCTLVIRKCEAHLQQQLAERSAATQTQAVQGGGVRPVVGVQWTVGDEVLWRGQLAEVVTVTPLNLELYLLDSRETVAVRPSQYSELVLAGQRSLDHEEIDEERLKALKPKAGRAAQQAQV